MYLFGTFQAQNPSEIAPLLPPSPGTLRALAEPGKRLPVSGTGGARAGRLGEYGHPAARNATEGVCRASDLEPEIPQPVT